MAQTEVARTAPLPATDVLRDFNTNDTNFDIKIPEEINYRNLVHKLENKAKHLEIQIEQNRKRGTAICQECFSAMRATEVLAFDFLFTEYLIGCAPISQVYTFVDSCIRPNFNIISGDPRDIDAAADHIRTVQIQIQNSMQNVMRSEQKKIESGKRTPDFLLFLKERKQSLEAELKKFEEDARVQKGQQNSTTVINVDFNDISKEEQNDQQSEVGSDLEKWLFSELKPGAVSVDVKTAEIRSLFGICIHRIQSIQDLQDQIAQLKSVSDSTQNLQYIDCDPQTIYNSPFFKAIKENCGFLGTALNAIHDHQQIVPLCISAIDSCDLSLHNLAKKCQNTISQMKQCTSEMENNIKASKEEIQTLSQNLKPFADALQFDVSSLDSLQKETDEFDQNIEKHLTTLFEQTKDEKIDSQLKILRELRETRSGITKLCQKSLSSIATNIRTQNDLFKAISSYSKAVESVHLYEREVQQLEEYERALKSVIEIMNVDEVTNWCHQLTEVSDALVQAVKSQEEIYASFEPLIQIDESGNEEVSEKEKEVDALTTENSRLIEEESQIQNEIVDAEEELFKIIQEIEALGGWSDQELGEKLSDCANCPICKEKQRNTILISCGHPMCSDCIATAKERHVCPICNIEFTDDDIKPFILQ